MQQIIKNMEEVSTTNPPAPTGVTPTEVPLGISGTMSEVINPVNIPRVPQTIFNLNHGMFLTEFAVHSNMGTGTKVFHWSSFDPFAHNNLYNLTLGPVETPKLLIPWDLVLPFYSRQCKIDWVLKFTPVKISDCRCSLDFILNYGNTSRNFPVDPNQIPLLTSNDTFHKQFDDQDDPFEIVIPMFWVTNNVQTQKSIYHLIDDSRHYLKPAYLPETALDVFIRNRYQPNQLQTLDFKIVVELFPIVRQTVGMAAPSLIRVNNPTLDDFLPLPYFVPET